MNATGRKTSSLRVGVWDLLEVTPLAAGLAGEKDVETVAETPDVLARQFAEGRLAAVMVGPGEIAHLPNPVAILSAGCLACDGKSLAATLVCRDAPQDIQTVGMYASHPSAELLLQVLWRAEYGTTPTVLRLRPDQSLINVDAVLLTSCHPPKSLSREFSWKINLSRLWFELTGLPMPWCLWVADPHADLEYLSDMLERVRQRAVDLATSVAAAEGQRRGWPEDIARWHVGTFADFEYHEDHADALRELLDRAIEAGLLETSPELRFYVTG